MSGKESNRSIYEYLDYRIFLKDYYESKKAANHRFSYRTLSDKIGFKTKDFILRVIRGEKNLSAQSIGMVADGLGLGKHESTYFEALVWFNQVDNTDERNTWYERMLAIQKVARFTNQQLLLSHYQYQIYSDWRHLVIRSLIGMHGFDGDYTKLANMVVPRIKPEEARKSIEILESCGLIKKDNKGRYDICQPSITTGDRVPKHAIQGFHQSCLKLGAASIDTMPPTIRNISGLTMGISDKGYKKIIERLVSFRKEVAQIAEEDEDASRVYQMNFLIFPLSE
jgi:uncharacterized protein (TIGR02147 family)